MANNLPAETKLLDFEEARIKATNQTVNSRYHELKGSTFPMVIMSITNLPHAGMLLINDHYFLPYANAEALIKKLETNDGQE